MATRGQQAGEQVQLSLFAPEELDEDPVSPPAPPPVEARTPDPSVPVSRPDDAPTADGAGDLALARGEWTPPPRRPEMLKAAIGEYQQFLVAQNRAKHTRLSFGLDLKLFLEHLGDTRVTQIGEADLRSFISWIRVERKNSPVSVRRKVASLKNFFAYLYRERLIPRDPALRLIYPETYPALPEFLEDRKVEDLLAAAREHLFWQALIALMLETGLKRDEVVALGWSDVSLGESEERGSYLVVRDTEQAKRLRSRRLEIGDEVAEVLRAYRAEQPVREHFFDVSARGVNFIVETCGGRARIITRGKKLTPQILRETFAVRRMRAMVREEEALREAGLGDETVGALIEAHDLQLLRLLGLHEEPESAKKYRKLVHGWAEHVDPGPVEPAYDGGVAG